MTTERTLFIVGGSSGIGEATVKKFLANGYSVTNLSRNPCRIASVENILCDVSEKESLDKALSEYVKTHSSLTVLVYSAGFSMAAPVEHVEEKDYRYLYEVNFFGLLKVIEKLLPLLRKNGGTVCAVSSIGGIQPIAYDSFYSSSKAAVNMLINALQLELLPKGVKAVSVMPGGTCTRFTFKRKIYPYAEAGDYADDMFLAVKSLHNIEQKGMKPSAVAAVIYRKCTSKIVSHTYAAGLINKIISMATRLLPQSVSTYLGTKIYFDR